MWGFSKQKASNLIWGGAGMNTARASARLNECADGKGLNIYVVGGSVSAGGKVSQCSSPGGQITTACKQDNQTREGRFQSLECKALSWTSKLEQALNNHFPCSGAGNVKHTVLNHARSAVASDFWFAHFMAARADPTHPIHSADIILLETSANDVSDIGDISPDHEWRDSPADQFPAAMYGHAFSSPSFFLFSSSFYFVFLGGGEGGGAAMPRVPVFMYVLVGFYFSMSNKHTMHC